MPRPVTAWIAVQPPERRAALRRVREAIRRAMPGAEEGLGYQMPVYRIGGRAVMYFGGWKEHVAIYPGTSRATEAFRTELAPYARSQGTIRFPLDRPVPVRLIERIARFRAAEEAARAPPARAAAPRRAARGAGGAGSKRRRRS